MTKTVLVCEAQVPFVRGGAELLVRGLVDELTRRGYRAERVSVPFKWYPKEELLTHAAAWRMIDLSESNGERIDVRIFVGELNADFLYVVPIECGGHDQ